MKKNKVEKSDKKDKKGSSHAETKDTEDDVISEKLEKMTKSMKKEKTKKNIKKNGMSGIEKQLDKLLGSIEKSAAGGEELPSNYKNHLVKTLETLQGEAPDYFSASAYHKWGKDDKDLSGLLDKIYNPADSHLE